MLKAVKNETEIDGAKKAHIRDGVSITKYIYWLKNIMDPKLNNEISVANHLENLRKKMNYFILYLLIQYQQLIKMQLFLIIVLQKKTNHFSQIIISILLIQVDNILMEQQI